MKYGTTKTGKVHIFTDKNECICDLNIIINKEVTKEYLEITGIRICETCRKILLNKPFNKQEYIHDLRRSENV
jgi:hypothetical protein